ncbi:hypothetical protein AB7942_23905 [Neobacillus sp. BF23-41]|uniref:hypothetical protein n=1 Tax=Neobacillus sp. BF23-41 TaxID=3240280 RepID=UPI0034E515B3
MKNKFPLEPNTKIKGTELTILDFWKWGYSDILTNSLRGVFAEFLVGAAIGALNQSRIEWDAFDLQYKDKKVEVKSAAYIQAWYNGTPSKISFSIGHKKKYDYETNTYSPDAARNADIYVFCLLKEENPEMVDPLDTSQWEFYIVLTNTLNSQFSSQKTIALSSLKKVSAPILYGDLRSVFDSLD